MGAWAEMGLCNGALGTIRDFVARGRGGRGESSLTSGGSGRMGRVRRAGMERVSNLLVKRSATGSSEWGVKL